MAVRYTVEHLLFLRDSPLCTKPEKLPPAEEWMGTKLPTIGLGLLIIHSSTRTIAALASAMPRGIVQVDPEDIVFAPPRMAFASSGRSSKTLESDKATKDIDPVGRFGLRNRTSEADGDRLADRLRAPNALRRRGENDLDGEGWSTVKPRKSFGAEGAERFHGRMGGNFRDEKKPVRENDRDATRDRLTRTSDTLARDKDAENDNRTRISAGRSKIESWHKTELVAADTPATDRKERDRTKSWRDRDTSETIDDRANGRGAAPDRRWNRDREQRVERDPEWFDEPAEALREAHTQQDFQKWMEQMKKGRGGGDAPPASAPVPEQAAEPERPHLPHQPMSAIESGPDKFFLAFGRQSSLEPNSPPSEANEAPAKPKAAGKSSRFTSFFHQPQEEQRSRVEQSTSVPPQATQYPPGFGPIPMQAAPPEEEKQAFQQLLLKLQKQSMSATPPAPSPFAPPPMGNHPDMGKKSNLASPEPFQQYGGERANGMARPPPQHVQEILAPRPQQQSARPDQLLQDLVGHHQRLSSQSSGIPDQARNNNNTEFLMNLMRMGPGVPPLSMPQSQPQPQKQQAPMLESDFSPRENRGPQRQMRPQPPPGFPLDESFHNVEREPRLGQPTQILQRPPPPMDQMPPNWMATGGQMPPPQQRGPMMPPPGLPGGLSRNVPMPHMFPPNFPPGGMPPPPEALAGMPPRNMPPPPPGFFNGPPHGFMPPGLGGFNGPPGPPEAFGGSPFEARGMPPGAAGRGAAFGRP
ncbi:hypothetical protein TRIATDRAFT_289140 [Trichoderma atroviride IMI 206040]|uniref:Uncharacterized protein n=2 Tax=Hypocrea atroviridis TaxID=63577 RepID=G9NGG9_HYPAI|nr:uncharacterized protein TRIATDRAFT_289140 [Trichoderma atroviride IMI 206040]EHK50380.1 hypothetical protein TRIATDRAFT_289140 [Trichoderma atroviride IMI 206040]